MTSTLSHYSKFIATSGSFKRFSTRGLNEEFFSSTSSRWLRHPERNRALRYQKFNVDALKNTVASSTGTDSVVDFHKLAEGRSNRIFQVRLSSGHNVIARIPTPLAGTPHLVTASEVATMRFLRDRLGLPQVPRIISWSSHAAATPVGAEYILMDVADGVELKKVWHTLSVEQKVRVVYQWIQFERKVISAIRGDGYGSIYYRNDIPAKHALDLHLAGAKDPDPHFVLGPAMSPPAFWEAEYDTPSDLNLDRGPCMSHAFCYTIITHIHLGPNIAAYLRSMSNTERTWIQRFSERPSRQYAAPWEPPAHLKNPSDHIRLLDMYDKVAHYFIPGDRDFLRPTLTLLDSNAGNIFISKEALDCDGSVEISAVIDWQHTAVLPSYLCTSLPIFVEAATPAPGQDQELFLKEQNHLRMAYRTLYSQTGWDDTWASVLTHGRMSRNIELPVMAQNCWHGGYVKLKKILIDVARNWKVMFPQLKSCPLGAEPFTEKDIRSSDQDISMWQAALAAQETMQEKIGVDSEGEVDLHDFDRAMQINRELFEEWLETVSSTDLDGTPPTKIWPYILTQ